MKMMKKMLSLFLVVLLLIALTASMASVAKASNLIQKIPEKTINPSIIPTPAPQISNRNIKIPPLYTMIIPNLFKTPAPTKKPQKTKTPAAGKFVTSEGPLFIMFRDDLTEGNEMFTPMDLSLDEEYVFPLISSAMHTVGNVKVTVKKGMVTVQPQMFSGVKLTDGILTFFNDLQSVHTIMPKELKSVDIPFDVPINITSRLGVDDKVLMYLNCPVSYNKNNSKIKAFSLEDQAYLERMYALIDLMD